MFRSSTLIWVRTRHQYRISALVLQKTFCGEVSKCQLLSQAIFVPEDTQRIRINMSLRTIDKISRIVLLLRESVELFCVFATTEYIFLAFCHLDIVLESCFFV